MSLKLHGLSNWGLRLVANGRFVSCEFFRNRMEATFATMLFREMSKQKDAIDFTKLLNAFTTPGQDPQEWDTKLTSIKNLVQATLDHYKTLCPQDPQQAILEQLEKLKAENAALKAGQVLDSTDPANPPPTSGQSSQVAAQPKQPGQAHLGNYFASPSASPSPNAPADPLATYRRKDGTAFYAVHPPHSGTDAKVRDMVKRYVPKDRQDQLSKSIDSLQKVPKQFDQANAPNLEPILSDWGLSSAILAKCNVDAQIRLLAAIQLLRN